MVGVMDEVHEDHFSQFEVVAVDEFDDRGEEVGYVPAFGHAGE